MSEPLQHYVPKFMLRRFSSGGRELVHAFDKHQDKIFAFSTSKKSKVGVAAERAIYDFEFLGMPMTLEPALSNLETKAAEVAARVIAAEALPPAWHEEKATLASFLAVQLVRTKATMATFDDLSSRMEGFFRAEGAPEEFFQPDPLVSSKENARKAHYAAMITNASRDWAPLLLQKVWHLIKTTDDTPFFMGDHPVVRFNDPNAEGRGKLGLASTGVQLYFPLSPTLALSLMCPTYLDMMIDGIERIDRMLVGRLGDPGALRAQRKEISSIVETLLTGAMTKVRPENVEHFNSLQVLEAERYVFSIKNDFTLVREMIQGDDSIRRGTRLVEGSGHF
jgi:hypothetical protein